MSEPAVVNDADAGRYRLMLDGAEIGFVEYDPIGQVSVLIKHTEIVPGHEGKGYGSLLVRHVLDDLRRRNLTVVPICTYTLNFIRKNREYVDLVRADMRSTV
jgi:predicted GNAT family acetyltransferase